MDILKKLEKLEKESELEAFIKKFIKKSTRFSGMPVSILKKNPEILDEFDKYRERKEQEQEEIKQSTDHQASSNDVVTTVTTKTDYGRRKTDLIPSALPIWPDAKRGAPNCILRSALFGAIKKGSRKKLENKKISVLEGIEITYTGERLDQADLDVWCGVLHVAREYSGNRINFKSNDMLDLIGLPTSSGANHYSLYKRLTRLNRGRVTIRGEGFFYSGYLIPSLGGIEDEAWKKRAEARKKKAEADETKEQNEYYGEYAVVLDDVLLELFAPDRWTALDWEVRRKLGHRALALWLHGFYSTHSAPYPYTIEKIYSLCGSEASTTFHFKAELKKAIALINKNTDWEGDIKNDKVHFQKPKKAIAKK